MLDMTIKTEHIEIDGDAHDVVLLFQEEVCFEALSLSLVFKPVSHALNELNGILMLSLLLQDLDVKHNELFINCEVLLFHQFQHEEISDIEDLCLEFQIQTDQVHRFDGPLRVQG